MKTMIAAVLAVLLASACGGGRECAEPSGVSPVAVSEWAQRWYPHGSEVIADGHLWTLESGNGREVPGHTSQWIDAGQICH